MSERPAQTALIPRQNYALVPSYVGSLGNIDAYIAEVNRIPMLSLEHEMDLAFRFREHNDLAAAQELVLSHLRLVVSIARGYLGYGLPHADLIQEGNIGLMKAVKRFDPAKGVRLVSYAIHWIKAEIHEFILKNWRMVKVATTKAQRKLFFNLRSHRNGNDSMTEEQISSLAEKLNVRREDVLEMETRMNGRDIALEAPADDEDAFAPISHLSSEDNEPSRILEAMDSIRLQSEGLDDALGRLDPRSRRIIEARWLADEDEGGGATLHTLASEFGVSAERIRQIETAALKKMRATLADYQ